MEREISKDVKLTPKPVKIGLISNLTLPTLEIHDFNVILPEKEEEKRDPTQEFRKSRTKIAQNRRDKNALF